MKNVDNKTNWGKAAAWTAFVAAITCAIFVAIIVFAVQTTGYLDKESDADKISRQVTAKITVLTSEVRSLREQGEKIRKYLELWTPMKCRKELSIKEEWVLPGYGVPKIVPRSYIYVEQEDILECSPAGEFYANDKHGAVDKIRDVSTPQKGPRSRKN